MSFTATKLFFLLLATVCLLSSSVDATKWKPNPRNCYPAGCRGAVWVKKGKRYGRISKATCGGSCGASKCSGTARCTYRRFRSRGGIRIIARPVGNCACERPQPSGFVRTIEDMAMDGPTGNKRVDRLMAYNDM